MGFFDFLFPGPPRQPCSDIGHAFEARYDEIPEPLPTTLKSADGDTIEVLCARKKLIYVHDICPYCGTVVNRSTPKPAP